MPSTRNQTEPTIRSRPRAKMTMSTMPENNIDRPKNKEMAARATTGRERHRMPHRMRSTPEMIHRTRENVLLIQNPSFYPGGPGYFFFLRRAYPKTVTEDRTFYEETVNSSTLLD